MKATQRPSVSLARFAASAVVLAAGASVIIRSSAGRRAVLTTLQANHATTFILQGESLLHAIPLDHAFYRLPFPSVAAAMAFGHWGVGFGSWNAAYILIESVLVGAIAGSLLPGGLVAAAAAVLGLALLGRPDGYGNGPDAAFSLLLLVAAGLLVRRSRAPSVGNALLVAAALGATLTARSTLAFFPPLLAVCELFVRRREGARRKWKEAGIICFVPFLFLLPWIVFNRALSHRTVLLEGDLIAPGVVGAVKGVSVIPPFDLPSAVADRICADPMKPTADCIPKGSWPSLRRPGRSTPDVPGWGALALESVEAGNATDLVDDNVDVRDAKQLFAWALKEIRQRPLLYVNSWAARLRFLFLLHPILLAAFIAASWTFRRRPEFAILGLLASYYFLVHSFTVLMGRWFDPLWPVLAAPVGALAAQPLASRFTASCKSEDLIWRRVLLGCAVVTVAAAAACGVIVASYAMSSGRRAEPEAAVDAALGRAPNDSWLFVRKGRLALARDDASTAERAFMQAQRLAPNDESAALDLAWARAVARGSYREFLRRGKPSGEGVVALNLDLRAEILKANACLLLGDDAGVRDHLRLARAVHLRIHQLMRDFFRSESWLIGETRICEALLTRTKEILSPRSLGERLALVGQLALLEPDCAPMWIETAELAWEKGERSLSLTAQARALSASVRSENDVRRLMALALERGDARAAWRISAELVAGLPLVPSAWMDRADVAARIPDRRSALGALARVRELPMSDADEQRFLEAERKLSDKKGALAFARVRMNRAPFDAERTLDFISFAIDAGENAQARAKADEIDSAALPEMGQRRLAELYEREGDRAAVLKIFERLASAQPKSAVAWTDVAAARLKSGATASARKALGTAEALGPQADVKQRIALLYESVGDEPSALRLLTDLTREHPKDVYFSDLGICQYRLGRRSEAVASLRQSLKLNPFLLTAALTLGSVLTDMNQPAQALDVYRSALKGGRSTADASLRKLLLEAQSETASRLKSP